MKSYINHLKTTRSFGETLPKNYKPTMRSSATFPIQYKAGRLDTICTFLGYWLLKRNIDKITAIITIRNKDGEKINVESYTIDSTKSYVFKASQFLKKYKPKSFLGSFEIEIFSAVDMVFPYPAITFSFESKLGNTFVHTCGRIYNDYDDLSQNNNQLVPESGFDLYLDKKYEPFFSFINGPLSNNGKKYEIEIIDKKGFTKKFSRTLKKIKPFGTAWLPIFLKDQERKGFSGEKVSVKIKHNFKGFFPRFVAGNIYDSYKAISLTHSYYDTSDDQNPHSIYKNPDKKNYSDSTVSVPIDNRFDAIELVVYPILKKKSTNLEFLFFDKKGVFKFQSSDIIEIANNTKNIKYIDLLDLIKKEGQKLEFGHCKVVFDGRGAVPTRMKFGLNFSRASKKHNLPSNICFAANVPNKNIIKKPSTFKWCTVFSAKKQMIYLMNSSFVKKYSQNAHVKAKLWRELDDKHLKLNFKINANGVINIFDSLEKRLENFLGKNGIGWITLECNSPFVSGFYVTDFGKGVIGADHLY